MGEQLESNLRKMTDEELKELLEVNYRDYEVAALDLARRILEDRESTVKTTTVDRNISESEFLNSEQLRKYPALDFLVSGIKTVTWVTIATSSLLGLVMIRHFGLPMLAFIPVGILCIGIWIRFYAVAEAIGVFIDIEMNTRLTKDYIKKLLLDNQKKK